VLVSKRFIRLRRPVGSAGDAPLACVIGDLDLVRPLGLAGIRAAVVAPPGEPVSYSRFAHARPDWFDPWTEPDALVDELMRFSDTQSAPPILFYEGDGDLLLVSRNRKRLREGFRFVVPDAELVENLVDKRRFQALAERLGLPIPRIYRAEPPLDELERNLPLLVKPLTRRSDRWSPAIPWAKAVRVDTAGALRELSRSLDEAGAEAVVQEFVPGPETRIVTYHTYVDHNGETAAEFTGRKLRTYPREYGHSTAITVTALPDVAELGREIVQRLALRGVCKVDFKRAPDGTLRLLEVNPRFNLWHHPAAIAGANLPALVYGDLVGVRRSAGIRSPTRQVGWVWPTKDARAARASGLSMARWVPSVVTSRAKSTLAWDDPMPFMRGVLLPALDRRRHGASSAAAPAARAPAGR